MLKKTLLVFALVVSLNANSEELQTKESQTLINTICDEKYDQCALKCEENDLKNIITCNAECEKLYQECEQKENKQEK